MAEGTADVVVVGNGVAANACAVRLARGGLRPVVVGPGPLTDRPPLSKLALLEGRARLLSTPERLAELGVTHVDGSVVDADLAGRRLTVEEDGRRRELRAGAVVLAVGLSYAPPPVPGLAGAHVNATPAGLARLAPLLSTARRVLVVGAGLIGTETAATLAGAGHEVTVVDVLERPLDRLHDPLPALGAEVLAQLGARFLGGLAIEAVELDGRGAGRVLTAAHGALEADLVLAATGGRPAALPGLPGAVPPLEVDGDMRVPGLDGVYAIGDCCLPLHERFGRVHFPHWDTAIGTGDRAAAAILGEPGVYDRLPYWWSDLGPRRVAEVGVARLVAAWRDEAGIQIGRDAAGEVVCACVIDEPRRLREARALLGA